MLHRLKRKSATAGRAGGWNPRARPVGTRVLKMSIFLRLFLRHFKDGILLVHFFFYSSLQFGLITLKTLRFLLHTQNEIKHLGINTKAHKDVFFPTESKEKRCLFKLVTLCPL